MYTLKDIAVVIPTYNRAQDLQQTFRTLLPLTKKMSRLIIIDQSTDSKTRKLVQNSPVKNLKYYYSKIPSITRARNQGIKHVPKKARLICFLDDDVTLGKEYFTSILTFFNTYPQARAVAGYVVPQEKSRASQSMIEQVLRRVFFLGRVKSTEAKIISAYGNVYPNLPFSVAPAQWIPGVNSVFKREVFKEQSFDENLKGYTVAEDIDFSYRLYCKHPGSLFILRNAQVIHRASLAQRLPTQKIGFINQIDHFYFYFKNLHHNPVQKVLFAYSLGGIALLRVAKFVQTRAPAEKLKMLYFFSSLWYCITHISQIKQGVLRSF